MKKIIPLLLCLLIPSCIQQKAKTETHPERKYIYMDMTGCLHTDIDCLKLFIGNIGENNTVIFNDTNDIKVLMGKNHALKRIKVTDLIQADLKYCCNHCVSDVIYDSLLTYAKDKKHIPEFGEDEDSIDWEQYLVK